MSEDGATGSAPAPDHSREDAAPHRVALPSSARSLLITGAAVVVPIAVAAALVPFRADIPQATVALGLAVVVSLVAALGTRVTAAIAAIIAAGCFDFFFTKPYGAVSISSAGDIETAALLLVGGLIVGQLSARNRSNRGIASATSQDIGRIQAIAELMSSALSADEVVAAVGRSCRASSRSANAGSNHPFPIRRAR